MTSRQVRVRKHKVWGADDTDVIFAKPQELGSKNLYAYCDNNPVAREDYAGEFPIPCIVGAVVGAAVREAMGTVLLAWLLSPVAQR